MIGLNAESIPQALVRQGALDPSNLISLGCSVVGAGRRNQNYVVHLGEIPTFFVKCPRRIEDAPLIQREYRIVERLRSTHSLAGSVPQVVALLDDDAGAVYDIESIETVHHLFVAQRQPMVQVARSAGKTLARVHATAPTSEAAPLPLALALASPTLEVLHSLSQGGRELLRLLQTQEPTTSGLAKLANQWRDDSFIHNDLKWDNLLVGRSGSSQRRSRAIFVDWEIAARGDARWDIGSFAADALRSWLLSFPIIETFAPDLLLDQATFPLAPAAPAIRAFVDAYGAERQRPLDIASELMPYAAARLIQSAFEISSESWRVDGRAILMVQLAGNILNRPDAAARQLLRIDTV